MTFGSVRSARNVFLMALIVFAPIFAKAEIDPDAPKKSRATTRKYTTTVIEKDEEVTEDEGPTMNTVKEQELTARFGAKASPGTTSGCKTEEFAKKAVTGLKADCNAWLKDRKAELKSKYVVGSCDETCDDCGMHLQRCSVEGRVRYR